MDIAHGFHLLKDGGVWLAVGPDFLDLQRSPTGSAAYRRELSGSDAASCAGDRQARRHPERRHLYPGTLEAGSRTAARPRGPGSRRPQPGHLDPLTVVGVCRGEREHENQVLGPIEPCRSASVLFSKEKPPSTAGILHHRPQCRRNLRATRASTPVRSHLRPGHVWSIRTPKGDPPTIACEVCPPPDPRDEWHEGNLPEPGTFRYRGGTTCQMHPPRQGFRPPGSPGGSRPRLANWM
jgi:hypothetical protein